jgi:hypothetical protein
LSAVLVALGTDSRTSRALTPQAFFSRDLGLAQRIVRARDGLDAFRDVTLLPKAGRQRSALLEHTRSDHSLLEDTDAIRRCTKLLDILPFSMCLHA